MRQLKHAMDKEIRYNQLIQSLQNGHGQSNSNGPSPNKEPIGDKRKVNRRNRSMTTGAMSDMNNPNSKNTSNTNSKGKLPNLSNGKYHRHNHTRAYHCFD